MTLDEIDKVMMRFCLLPQKPHDRTILGKWESTDFEVTLWHYDFRRGASFCLKKKGGTFCFINVNLFLLEASGLYEMLSGFLDDTTPDTNICRHLPDGVYVESVGTPYVRFGETDMCRDIVLRGAERLGKVTVYDYGDHYSLGCEDDEIDVRQEWVQDYLAYLCCDDCLSAVMDWAYEEYGEVVGIQETQNGLAFDVRVGGSELRVCLDYQDFDRALCVQDKDKKVFLWYKQCYDEVPLAPAKVKHLLDEALAASGVDKS